MKNLILYYISILVPLILLLWVNSTGKITFTAFSIFFLLYLLVYRTFIDGVRLVNKQVLKKKDIWKMVIPGKRIVYFKALYFK